MTQSLITENTENGRTYEHATYGDVGVAQWNSRSREYELVTYNDCIGFFSYRRYFTSLETCDWMMLAYVAELEATGH